MSAKNYLDLAKEYDTDDTVREFEYVEYLDENSNEPNKTGIRTFNTRDEDVFLLPHKAMLEVHGRILTAAGGDIAAGTEIALVNNGWSLFKRARYQLANQTVEDISMHLPIASTILNIISFSDDYSRSVATNMMWFKDNSFGTTTSGEFISSGAFAHGADAAADVVIVRNFLRANAVKFGIDAPASGSNAEATRAYLNAACVNLGITSPGTAADGVAMLDLINGVISTRNIRYNEGFAKRKAFAAESRQITMMLPLSTIFGFCRDYNKVFRGIKHTLI